MRKKKKKDSFALYDRDKNFLKNCLTEEFPIPKEVIVKKSICFFDDPAPCYIRINAVKVRILAEICKYMEKLDEPIFIYMLPKDIQEYLDFGKEVFFIEYCSDK